jgi:hypothetical protein
MTSLLRTPPFSRSGHVMTVGHHLVDLPKGSPALVWGMAASSALTTWRARRSTTRAPAIAAALLFTSVGLLVTNAWRTPATDKLAEWHPRQPASARRPLRPPSYQRVNAPSDFTGEER